MNRGKGKDQLYVLRTEALRKFKHNAEREWRRQQGLPPLWFGTWRDAHGPRGERVSFSAGAWTVSFQGRRISRHNSRNGAFQKARKIDPMMLGGAK